MSLAKRLAAVVPQASNRTCGTCKWLDELDPIDRAAWDEWVSQDRSLTQLWEIAVADDRNPYTLSLASLRACVRIHQRQDT
jgi:hypothetical protein